MVIPVAYLRHILFISCPYLGYILDIYWAYLEHILSISRAYHGHAFGIPHSLFKANRFSRHEILAWSQSVFIQFSFCRKQRFMQPLRLSIIKNCYFLKPKIQSGFLSNPSPLHPNFKGKTCNMLTVCRFL